jgi:putative membrane protein
MDYRGIDGFLGNRASFMLDVVFLAMFVVVPVMGWSIYQVKIHKRYLLHKRVQVAIGLVLLVAVTLFEIDIRVNGWRERAAESPYYNEIWSVGLVNWSLWIHLVFAISSTFLWIFVIIQALRKFPSPPLPNEYGPRHKFWARIAALDLSMTALTGWIFYWLAFVATAG